MPLTIPFWVNVGLKTIIYPSVCNWIDYIRGQVKIYPEIAKNIPVFLFQRRPSTANRDNRTFIQRAIDVSHGAEADFIWNKPAGVTYLTIFTSNSSYVIFNQENGQWELYHDNTRNFSNFNKTGYMPYDVESDYAKSRRQLFYPNANPEIFEHYYQYKITDRTKSTWS